MERKIINKLREAKLPFTADEIKDLIIEKLKEDGYRPFAERLELFNFVLAEMYGGHKIDIACFVFNNNTVVINPDMIRQEGMEVSGDIRRNRSKMFEQLSVVVRHELLHYLLKHNIRFLDYLKKKYPDDWQLLRYSGKVNLLDNYAADYDLSRLYSEEDKEVVRLLTKNNQVLGGLILSDDHKDWINLTYEELEEKLITITKEDIEKMKEEAAKRPTAHIKRKTHSPEYVDIYNKVIKAYDSGSITVDDINIALARVEAGESLEDTFGNIILREGE